MGDNSEMIRSFETTLQPSGGGDGTSVYIDAETTNWFDLTGEDVTVELIKVDGKPEIRIKDFSTGVSEDDVMKLADEHEWEHKVSNAEMVNDDEPKNWGHTFRTSDDIRIEIDGFTHIDGGPLNNIHVQAPSVRVTNAEAYCKCLQMVANSEEVNIRVTGGEGGLLTKAQAAGHIDIDDPPSPETISVVLQKLDVVFVGVKWNACSLLKTVEEVEQGVALVRDLNNELNSVVD